jgi:8-oxo-dGTP pyrophosphatase MutT (NUDIX family)
MANSNQNQPCLSKEGIEKGLKELLGPEYNEKVDAIIKDNFIGWFSRSMATVLFVFARNKSGEWCVLANKRGSGCPDFVGYWCVPCGYLEFDIDTRQNAVKELWEETGVHVKPKTLEFFGFEDDPSANHQNVTFRYYTVIGKKLPKWIPDRIQGLIDLKSPKTSDFKLSRNLSEENEVDEIRWIPISDVDKYAWAFGHEDLIGKIVKTIGLI